MLLWLRMAPFLHMTTGHFQYVAQSSIRISHCGIENLELNHKDHTHSKNQVATSTSRRRRLRQVVGIIATGMLLALEFHARFAGR